MFGKVLTALTIATALLATPTPVEAQSRVQRVISPGGIEAWLVTERTVPLVAMEFFVRGGSAQDPQGREGLASLTANLMDEGAGDLAGAAYQERLKDLAVSLGLSAQRDGVSGSFRSLTINLDAGLDLLRLALVAPRFDQSDIDRVRQQMAAGLRREESNPNAIASRTMSALAFPGHPYGRPTSGTLQSLAQITRDDIVAYHRAIISRQSLKVAVVGDIDAARLGPLLDRVFGGLPASPQLNPVADVTVQNAGAIRVVEMDVPQTVIQLLSTGIKRDDQDFIAATVMNHILGGGSFNSRLFVEVREKRGLAYSVFSGLNPLDSAGLFMAGTSTRNDRAAESLALIEAEIRRMAAEGPTQEELDKAKSFLVGSYALRFDTSARIAGMVLSMQVDNLGIDWMDRRNGLVQAVTLDDVRRAARRVLAAERLVVMVGRPVGVQERRPGG